MNFLHKIRNHDNTQNFLPAIKRMLVLFFFVSMFCSRTTKALDIEIMNSPSDIFVTKQIWVRCTIAKNEKMLIKKGLCWALSRSTFALVRVYDQSEPVQIFSRAFGRVQRGFVQPAVFKIVIEQQEPASFFEGELGLSGLLEKEDGGVEAFYKNIFIKSPQLSIQQGPPDNLMIKKQTVPRWQEDYELFVDQDLRFITDSWAALLFTIKLLFVFIVGSWLLLIIVFFLYKIFCAIYLRRKLTISLHLQDIVTLTALILLGLSLFAHAKMDLFTSQIVAVMLFLCGALLMFFCLKREDAKKLKTKIKEVLAFSCCSISLPLLVRAVLNFYRLL